MSKQGFRQIFKWDDPNLKELNDMLRWLYSKVTGRVEMRDLSTETKTTIDSKADGAVVGEIKDTADQAKKDADAAAGAVFEMQGDVEQAKQDSLQAKLDSSEAQQKVTELNTELIQTKDQIALKADKTTVDTLTGKVTENSAQLKVTAEAVESTVRQVETLNDTVSEHSTQITQTAEKIESKAEKSVVDALGNTVSEHSTQITQTAEKIESKADQTVVDELSGTVSKHSSQISQTPGMISAAVSSVQLGGRNRIPHTKPMDLSKFGFDSSGAAAMGGYEAYEGGLYVINRQSNLRVWLTELVGKLSVSPGQSITVSFKYAMLSGNSPLQIQANWYRNANDTAPGYADSDPNEAAESYRFPQTMQMVDGGWGWVQATFIVPDGYYLATFAFRSGQDFRLYDCEYIVKEFKIENGNKATDWSPAPEDTDAAIDKLSAELIIQAGDITANATKIETVNAAAVNAQSSANTAQNAANAAQNAANAAQGTANGAVTRVTTAETRISAVEGAVTTKVSKDEFNALGGRVSSAEGALTVQSNAISAEVTRATAAEEALSGRIDVHEDAINLAVGRTVGGTNLIRFGTLHFAAVINSAEYNNYGRWADTDETWYNCSRKTIVLNAFSGDYNIAAFHSIPLKQGVEYTVSFNLWHENGGSGITMMPNLWNAGRGVDWGFMGTINVVASTPTRYEHTFVCPATDTYYLRFISFGGNNAPIYLTDVKLEEGNTATAWSAHPREFMTGSNVSITEEEVRIVSPKTFIGIPDASGDRMVAQFDENGATLDRLTANNVTYRYDGPSTIWINPNASSDDLAGGAVYRSLSDLFGKLNGKMLDMELVVHMQGNDYGAIAMTRVFGGSVTIHGNGIALTGSLSIVDCGLRVYVYNMNIINGGTNPAAWVYGKGSWVRWQGCTFNGANVNFALMFGQGGGGSVWDCGLYNAPTLLYVGHASDISVDGARGGNCTHFAATDGCTAKFSGTRPDGVLAMYSTSLVAPADPNSLPIDYGTAQPSVPAIQTAAYNFLYSDSYCTGWSYFSDDDVRQGYNGNRIYGVIWFDTAAMRSALSGKTINQASLRLHAQKGIGRGVAVGVQLYGTNMDYSGRTGQPAQTASYGTIGTAEPGVVTEITIPTQVITDLINGTTQALMLLSDDTTLYKDRGYSQNYARFDGSSSGDGNTRPRLTVVYQ